MLTIRAETFQFNGKMYSHERVSHYHYIHNSSVTMDRDSASLLLKADNRAVA